MDGRWAQAAQMLEAQARPSGMQGDRRGAMLFALRLIWPGAALAHLHAWQLEQRSLERSLSCTDWALLEWTHRKAVSLAAAEGLGELY